MGISNLTKLKSEYVLCVADHDIALSLGLNRGLITEVVFQM